MILIWSEGKGYGLENFYKILPLYGSVNVTNFVSRNVLELSSNFLRLSVINLKTSDQVDK